MNKRTALGQAIPRRQALKLLGAAGLGTILAAQRFPLLASGSAGRVAVVGGGFGGATAAKYLKMLEPGLEVTLIEPQKRFYTCPFTNLYLGGLRDFESLGHGYDELTGKFKVRVIHETAEEIDAEKRSLTLSGGETLEWDRLVLSPGVEIKWDALEGYGREAAKKAPHAWQAGPQTILLKQQLEAMPDGGVFILVAPDNPYRCPPGPYERVSMVAHYCKTHKPKSKVLLLDSKDNFSKQGLFLKGWEENYGDMIEWVGLSGDGRVVRVDADGLKVESEFGAIHKADVLNVVPPQKAGFIADRAGVSDESGWVPVDPVTFQSRKVEGIYVLGDATEAAPMPKSGFVANNQAKIAARAIVNDLADKDPIADPKYSNTCYSLIAPEYGISVANVFDVHDGELREVPGSGGVSPMDANAGFRRREADYAFSWYAAISQDTWGTPVSRDDGVS